MAGTGPQDLHSLAEDLLDACVTSLDTIPVFAPALGGAPERRFISPGQPAFDCCDQLTVHVAGVADAPTAPSSLNVGTRARFGKVNLVHLDATLTRCVPVVTAKDWPTPAAMESASEQLNADGWALWNHTFNLVAAGQLFQYCGEVYWDGLNSIVPQGGCGGWLLRVRVRLDGYQEVLGT